MPPSPQAVRPDAALWAERVAIDAMIVGWTLPHHALAGACDSETAPRITPNPTDLGHLPVFQPCSSVQVKPSTAA